MSAVGAEAALHSRPPVIKNRFARASVRQRDDHKPSPLTVHCPRSLPLPQFLKLSRFQCDIGSRRFMHNHPSGDPTPSGADVQMTKQIVDIAKPLGIAIHDHIIVGRNGHATLKGLRLI